MIYPYCSVDPNQKHFIRGTYFFAQRDDLSRTTMLKVPSHLMKWSDINYWLGIHEPKIIDLGDYAVLPRNASAVFREYKQFEEVHAQSEGFRSVATGTELELRLSYWRDESADSQVFRESIKGCGTRKWVARRNPFHLADTSQQLSENERYFGSRLVHGISPAGIQRRAYALDALNSKIGRIKSSPVTHIFCFPDELIEYIEKSSLNFSPAYLFGKKDLRFYKPVQEKRLMPSGVRGIYLDRMHADLTGLVRSIGEGYETVSASLDNMFEDVFEIFNEITLQARYAQEGYKMLFVGEGGYLSYHPVSALDYLIGGKLEGTWFFGKDIVLAQSGLWFVDGESLTIDDVESNRFYLANYFQSLSLLRELTRILTKVRIGQELNRNAKSSIGNLQEEVTERLVESLNRSRNIRLKSDGKRFELEMHFPAISKEIRMTYNGLISGLLV